MSRTSARYGQDHAKSHSVMPPCMALTNSLSSAQKVANILIQRTLGLNLMPFGQEPTLSENEPTLGSWAFLVKAR